VTVGDGGSIEAEAFATRTAGGRQADAQASGGAMWNLWSNGAIAQDVEGTGRAEVVVRARGTFAGGVAPHMDVLVGGVRVLSADPGTAYADHRATVELDGPTEVRIVFTNDAVVSGQDRNLIVDVVRITSANGAPVAAFDASPTSLTVAVDASGSSDPDGDVLTFQWDFGDGSTATGPTATHTYGAAGTYTVGLTVSDGTSSATASATVTAVQPNRAPSASFAASTTGLSVAVDASGSSDPDGDALAYAWDFGDGTSGAGRTATRTYAAAGTYTVTLTVSDGRASASASHPVEAKAQPFTATFSVASGSNEWWQEVKVASSSTPAKVEMSVAGGPWKALTLRSWGNWATSTYVPKGTPVAFRATDASGQVAQSSPQPWLGAPKPPATFTATFLPKSVGNDWWVEVQVKDASQAVAKVEAQRNGGAWTELPKSSWGTYAKSLGAPNGTQVVFRATSTSGAVATSAPVVWK
jgi:PKD repeat protein